MAAHLTRWQRIEIRLAMLVPRSLCYWVAMRMMAEHVRQPNLPRMSRVARASYVGHLRMNHVVEEFAARVT